MTSRIVERLKREGACLPGDGDLLITNILGGVVATLDPQLPGAQPQVAEKMGWGHAKQALVILVDGLGYELLTANYGCASTLRSLRDRTTSAYTVVPSTTAAAITAFATGCQPAQTCMVGYSVARGDDLMTLLAFNDYTDPVAWQSCDPVFTQLRREGVDSAVVSAGRFAGSGLTLAALRGSRHVPAEKWEDRVDAAVRELRAGTPLVYLYWSEVDHVGHEYGPDSIQWQTALEDFDAGLGMLLSKLPTDVTAVLTADHGMIQMSQEFTVNVAFTPELCIGTTVCAGEPRAVHVHCEPGSGEAVRQRWIEYLDDRAWVVGRDELPALMGDGPGNDLVGDFVVFARDGWGIVDSRTQSAMAVALPGVHGGLTSAEMLIPVVTLSHN